MLNNNVKALSRTQSRGNLPLASSLLDPLPDSEEIAFIPTFQCQYLYKKEGRKYRKIMAKSLVKQMWQQLIYFRQLGPV